MSSGIDIQVQGFPELIAKIEKLRNDKSKKREMVGILKQVASGTVKVAKRNAPVSKKAHLVSGSRTRKIIQPGNLKKSIGTIVARKGKAVDNPTVVVGPRAKGKNDGWYGNFVEQGHYTYKGKKRNSRKNATNQSAFVQGKFFMKQTFAETEGKATAESEQRIAKYIQRKLERL